MSKTDSLLVIITALVVNFLLVYTLGFVGSFLTPSVLLISVGIVIFNNKSLKSSYLTFTILCLIILNDIVQNLLIDNYDVQKLGWNKLIFYLGFFPVMTLTIVGFYRDKHTSLINKLILILIMLVMVFCYLFFS